MQDAQREIQEAVQAADRALRALNAARDCLRSAGNWGIADMLGGGTFFTLMKRSKMNGAQRELSNARDALRAFARELSDVDGALRIDVCSDDFLHFADYFFDGLVADWLVQRRINDAKAQVEDAITRVTQLRNRLTRL